jgi:hypothetical protein
MKALEPAHIKQNEDVNILNRADWHKTYILYQWQWAMTESMQICQTSWIETRIPKWYYM